MEGSFQFNADATPFIPASLSSFANKAPEKQGESSSKGNFSAEASDLLHYEEHEMDQNALAKLVSMFPNVSPDFIAAILEANEFDINLTIDMIHELNSPDMPHDDAELGLPAASDNNDLHAGQGIPDADNHRAEMPESVSNLNQVPQDEKSGTSSGVKAVAPMFPEMKSLHNDLGVLGDGKSVPTAAAE